MSDSIISTPTLTGILDNRGGRDDDRGRDHLNALLHHGATQDRHSGNLHILKELADTRREVADKFGDIKEKVGDLRVQVAEAKGDLKDLIRKEVCDVKDMVKDLDRERDKAELQIFRFRQAACLPTCAVPAPV